MIHIRKCFLKTALVLSGLLLLLAVAAMVFPQLFLCVDSGPVRADVIVVLGGGSHERPVRAAALFQEHAAPRIIVSGWGDCQINRRLLMMAGVPARAIELEAQSRTTRENARLVVKLLREKKLTRVIIVTSWYHSRRALACFRHYAPELKFYSRPSYFAISPANWLHTSIGSRIRLEYAKLLGYWIRYGICPVL